MALGMFLMNFTSKGQIAFQSGCINSYTPISSVQASIPLQHLWSCLQIWSYFILSNLADMQWCPVVLISIFKITNEVEHIFISLLAIHISSSVKQLLIFFHF